MFSFSPRRWGLLLVATGALATLLAGCNATKSDQIAGPPPPNPPRGDLTLSAAESSTASLTSSTCTFTGGKPTAFNASGDGTGGTPSITGSAAGQGWQVRLATTSRPAGYTADGLAGVTVAQEGGIWKVTLSNVELTAADKPGTVVKVSGNVLCGPPSSN